METKLTIFDFQTYLEIQEYDISVTITIDNEHQRLK